MGNGGLGRKGPLLRDSSCKAVSLYGLLDVCFRAGPEVEGEDKKVSCLLSVVVVEVEGSSSEQERHVN